MQYFSLPPMAPILFIEDFRHHKKKLCDTTTKEARETTVYLPELVMYIIYPPEYLL
jgi:hypothetical protein